MALVNGFAGLRDIEGDDLRFVPRLPADWEAMSFRLIVRGSRLEVEMTTDATTYRLLDGEPLSLISDGERFTVSTAAPVILPVPADGGRLGGARPSRSNGAQQPQPAW
jgi:alpha,alpha-trehalose phosphorylase